MTKKEFLAFLRCLYLPADPITEDNVVKIAKVAEYLNCKEILTDCEQFLKYNFPQDLKGFKEQIVAADSLNDAGLLKRLLDKAHREYFAELLKPQWTKSLKRQTAETIQEKAAEHFAAFADR